MRVLIIDDDSVAAEGLKLVLETTGMVCNSSSSGEEGIEYAKLYEYDIVILDILMPDMDGHEVLSKLRENKITTPVLMLSGLQDEEAKVKGFSGGADDYLTKPFSKGELIARINAIVRRTKGFSASEVSVGDLNVNLTNQIVTVKNKQIQLTKKEYGILELLILRKGSVLPKETFLNHLYNGMDEPELKIIDVFVCKLRKKLETASGGVNYIETVWGRGYMLRSQEKKTRKKRVKA